MKKIAVVYHGDCPDGFGGAWAAWKKLGDKAEYVGALDRVNPPAGLNGKEVYFIDWVYPMAVMKNIQRHAKRVIVIDHHESRRAEAMAMDDSSFDNDRSGAVLAWRYFHPGEPVPALLKHIEDVDIWRWRLRGSKQISAFLQMQPFEFRHWSRLMLKMENPAERRKILAEGDLLLKYEDKLIAFLAEKARLVRFEGHRVLALNSPLFTSQLGNVLSKKQPPFAIIWREEEGQIRASLRSIGKFNVAKIAEKFGGGGHRNAAGLRLDPKKPIPWKPVK